MQDEDLAVVAAVVGGGLLLLGRRPSGGSPGGSPGATHLHQTPHGTVTHYTPGTFAACAGASLKVGAAGPCVALVQDRLNYLMNAGLGAGGHFDGDLVQAVKAFQRQQGLKPTGTVDAATWAALESPKGYAFDPAVFFHPV